MPETPQQMLARLNREAGREACERCSTPEWQMFHEPGPCPTCEVCKGRGVVAYGTPDALEEEECPRCIPEPEPVAD